ncbi:MAG: 3-methyl-2-oxobutanoate hydroxymethyltransferase [Candidatus Muproteobacteria bacterium RBG_16_60_9]|uniref:3-methyl-2-oxobutanoate hydroxymethyltransferase n=1 Tax=Candidatus Muproteobacteria bacterium RBG_16_60_9 TaxID=1817755 RepID=A0A1F6UWQ9_9PROT|nr:MAG: 3-methyl-2-oxobutanoate hydroxymethyltransferase [Candidatus Muproteobacteria bacterium RBG_16_60_9]
MKTSRLSTVDIIAMKHKRERIVALTAYDYTSAQMLDAAGIDIILVGDTLGMVVQGEETTLPVSLDDVLYHARMVMRGARRALVVADMPFMSYQVSTEDALRNAGRLMKEAHVGAVKIEGGADVAPLIERLVKIGIPVCGHLGFTPQSTHTLGGPRVQGRTVNDAVTLIADAQALASAGAFAIVLELVPASLAEEITQRVRVPTIGIGSGPACDGEIQVFHDLFGLYTDFQPRHTRRYLNVAQQLTAAAKQYREDVTTRTFPGPEQTIDLKPEVKEELREFLRRSSGAVKSIRAKGSRA